MYSKMAVRRLALVGQACRSRSSVCRVAKKLSATALSAGVPLLPMLGTTPVAARCLPKRRLPYGYSGPFGRLFLLNPATLSG